MFDELLRLSRTPSWSRNEYSRVASCIMSVVTAYDLFKQADDVDRAGTQQAFEEKIFVLV